MQLGSLSRALLLFLQQERQLAMKLRNRLALESSLQVLLLDPELCWSRWVEVSRSGMLKAG